jgi:hypothetical protein
MLAGIDFVIETIEKFLLELYKDDAEACFKAKERWWHFFEYWMDEDSIAIWNVTDILDDDEKIKLINRTSNGLERYNRHFNGIIPSKHPNLVIFACALRSEADKVIQKMEDIDKRREIPPKYSEPRVP